MFSLFGLLALVNFVTATAIPSINFGGHAKAVYFMSNSKDGNQIYALPVDGRGFLSDGSVTETGGKGAKEVSPTPGDSLGSQGSLVLSGNYLYAVNAGSNTVTVLEIDQNDPLKLTIVGEPVDSQGDFPNSIVVSSKLQLACVTNSGTRANINCFRTTKNGLKPYDKTPRSVSLNPAQSNPPVGPPNTISQALFNHDESALITLVKGDPFSTPIKIGYVSYFPIHNGEISREETRSVPNGTVSLFGSLALPGGNVFATDFAYGTVLLGFDKNGVASNLYKYSIPQQGATCWVAQSPVTNTLYVTDAAYNTIVGFSPFTGKPIQSSTQNATGDPVTVLNNDANAMNDIAASGNLLYATIPGGPYPGKPGPTKPPQMAVLQEVGLAGVKVLQTFTPKIPANTTLDDAMMGIAVLERGGLLGNLPF